MARRLIVFAVLVGAASRGDVQSRTIPELDGVVDHAVEAAGAVTGPAVDPLLQWIARREIGRIADQLRSDVEAGRRLPYPDHLESYLIRRGFATTARRDPWGGAYALEVSWDSAYVVSSGPDGRAATPDDIRLGIPAVAPPASR